MGKVYYKGFNKNMTCLGFQFKEGETYEEESAELCQSGFHACERPLDVFNYYEPNKSVYHTVELDDVSPKLDGDDTKVCAKKIKIGAALDIRGLVKAQVKYVKAHTTTGHTDPKMATAGDFGAATAGNFGAATAGNSGAATAGDSGAATAGDSGAATAGDRGAATAGNRGAATAGDSGAATAGDFGAATAGNRGAATAGDFGAATAGDRGAATAGNRGAATSRGRTSVGKNGVGLARGKGVKVRGGIGAILLIAEENDSDSNIKEWRAFIVDGEMVEADTWYQLKDGELVECEDK